MISKVFFDIIQQHYNNAQPFVVYRKPNESEVKVLLQNDDLIYYSDDYTESGFVFAPFDDKEKSILIPYDSSVIKTLNYSISNPTKAKVSNSSSDTFKEEHIKLVQKGIDAIKNQEFQKVVLSRCEAISLSNNNPFNIFKKLLNAYPTAFVYCWYHPKVGLWLGATPETLIHLEANRFKTMALAGTQKFKGSLDVVWHDKEKLEQQYVTNFILNVLKESAESIKVSKTTTRKAGNVLHLNTYISGILNSNLNTVLQKLHPTPAVCGMPKESAMEFILNEENYNREFYTGFLGELNIQNKQSRNLNRQNVENNAYASIKKESHLFVNLRCMKIKDTQALIYIGGGITKESIPENEWQETINKTLTIKGVLD